MQTPLALAWREWEAFCEDTPRRAGEVFESVARGHFQIGKICRPVQLCKLPEGRAFDVHPALHALPLEERSGVFALEVLDRHGEQ